MQGDKHCCYCVCCFFVSTQRPFIFQFHYLFIVCVAKTTTAHVSRLNVLSYLWAFMSFCLACRWLKKGTSNWFWSCTSFLSHNSHLHSHCCCVYFVGIWCDKVRRLWWRTHIKRNPQSILCCKRTFSFFSFHLAWILIIFVIFICAEIHLCSFIDDIHLIIFWNDCHEIETNSENYC